METLENGKQHENTRLSILKFKKKMFFKLIPALPR